MSKIFLGQPCYGQIEMESADAVDKALSDDSPHELAIVRQQNSLLANCFNTLLATCLQWNAEAASEDRFKYFCLLHADVVPEPRWLETLVAELEKYHLDVLSAVVSLKEPKGRTSTAVAFSADPWQNVRRITVRELARLWPTFTVAIVREQLVPEAKILLPNTGCMLIKLPSEGESHWLYSFPGFEIRDQLLLLPSPGHSRPHWQAWTVSEDWNFGFWCAAHDVRVGATSKIKTRHIGRMPFMTETFDWGQERDEQYFELLSQREAA